MTTPTPASVFSQLAARPGSAWLDGGGTSRWSVLTFDPVETVTSGEDWPDTGRRLTGPAQPARTAPFVGGCLGYLGYGAGHRVEAVPPEDPTPEPEIWLSRYEGGLCYDHSARRWHIEGSASWRARAERLLQSAPPEPVPSPAPPSSTRTIPREQHEDGVRRILQWIGEGDCYQVNLTRPVWVEPVPEPFEAYLRLRARSAPGWGAFLRLAPQLAVLSNSPERFLEHLEGELRSTPIKGTLPRSEHAELDARAAADLLVSTKDHAELTMIVDLVRNDLGRVAVPGSVRTSERRVVPHANVHHAEQDVWATLQRPHDLWNALAASFPPGSVTGAPKVRACKRIHDLEAHPRGVYCGAIGFASSSGPSSWSVAIRTAVWHNGSARYHVGGGIVADSSASSEWDETVAKGSALAAALGGPFEAVACEP